MPRDNITRRRWLAITGVAIGAGTVPTTAAACEKSQQKPNGGEEEENTSPDGTVPLAEYEVSGGEFVFEKDSDYLEVGDVFDFTATETKDGGKIVEFEFADADGVYDVHAVSVKTDEGMFEKTVGGPQGSFNVRNFDDSSPVQAVDNVILYAKLRWQIDFGLGDVPIPPNYTSDPPLILAALGGDGDVTVANPSAGPKNVPSSVDDGVLNQTEFNIDSEREAASISFTITDTGAPDLHLASFEIPGPFEFERDELAAQDLFDEEELDTPSKGRYTLEVDLPTVQPAGPSIPDTQVAKLLPSDGEDSDVFAGSVAVDGGTAVIGASQEDENGDGAGAAYVFTRSGETWSQQQKLLASDGERGDRFGDSVAVNGDTAVVGAKLDEEERSGAQGAAYVFTRSGETWSQQQKLLASDAETRVRETLFGDSVAVDGDTVAIGASQDSEIGVSAGAAYVFTRSGETWSQQQKLLASDAETRDFFGVSVAVNGDTAVIGASAEDENGDFAGAAYVFTRNNSTWDQQQKLLASDGEVFDGFGVSVAVDGDTAVIGASRESENADRAGAAYVFE